MKFNNGYEFRTVCGTGVLAETGRAAVDMRRLISLNDSAAFLYRTFMDREFEESDLSSSLVAEYGIDADTAARDAHAFCEALADNGILLR